MADRPNVESILLKDFGIWLAVSVFHQIPPSYQPNVLKRTHVEKQAWLLLDGPTYL